MKARRAGRMSATVRSCMTRDVITVRRETTLREIETLFFTHTIHYLPVVEEGRVVGLVTRTDYLKARAGGSSAPPLD